MKTKIDNLLRLDTLKDMLVSAEDFGDPLNYFFDLMEDEAMRSAGKEVKSEFLKVIIQEICKHLLHKTVVPRKLLIVKATGVEFYHGGFMIENRLGTIFYFKEIDMGLFALTSPFFKSPTTISRFSISKVKSKQELFTQNINRTWQ